MGSPSKSYGKARRLLDGGYLNDAVINAWAAQLNVLAGTAARAVYMASTHLFTMMREGRYARVARHCKQLNMRTSSHAHMHFEI